MEIREICRKVYVRRRLTFVLREACHLISALVVAAFALGFRFYLNISPTLGLKYLVVLAVPFAMVSFLRRYIGAPRPYEIYEFYERQPKKSEKNAFPSRHAFSIFAIGTIICFIYPAFGVALLLLGAVMCAFRVLLGYHFVRDVAVGGVIGILSSLIGVIFLR